MFEFKLHRSGPPNAALLGGWLREWRVSRLGQREWLGVFEGHQIRVRTQGPLPAHLYIDGECLDRRSPLVSSNPGLPLLSAPLPSSGHGARIVQVFPRGWCAGSFEVQICGETIAMTPSVDAG
jgi:hypothetical protein